MEQFAVLVVIGDMCFGAGFTIYGIVETFTDAPAGWAKIILGLSLLSNMSVIINCRWD